MENDKCPLHIDQFNVGMTACHERTITDADITAFAKVSGDSNPVHMSDEYARQSRYKKRIAHGLLSVSFFSALFGTSLPGHGCVYVSQSLNFRRAVYLGDTVKAIIEIIRIDRDRSRLFFKTICEVKGKTVIDGEAEIFVP
jgi:3-hydroxybutyryl-CoA dehydratase